MIFELTIEVFVITLWIGSQQMVSLKWLDMYPSIRHLVAHLNYVRIFYLEAWIDWYMSDKLLFETLISYHALVYVWVCKEDSHGRLKLLYLPRFCKVSGNTTSTFTTRCLATIVTNVGLPSKLRNWNCRACVTHYAFRLVKI